MRYPKGGSDPHRRQLRATQPSKTMMVVFLSLGILLSINSYAASAKPFTHRLVYLQSGMNNKGIDLLLKMLREGSKHGYNGLVSVDHELENLDFQSKAYFDNVNRAKAEADRLKMALIPMHFYQGQALYGQPADLARVEAFPVRNTKFIVKNGEARGVGDHDTNFQNGGFESYTGHKPDGWDVIQMNAGTTCLIDKSYKKEGTASLKMINAKSNARIKQHIKLKPFRAYRISSWIATSGLEQYDYKGIHYAVVGHMSADGQQNSLFGRRDRAFAGVLDWTLVSSNQGWREVHVDFNSLYSSSATVEFWANNDRHSPSGTVWIDGIRLEEVGLYETVRRKSQPMDRSIIVRSSDGSKTYKEGTDYVVDPKCNSFTDKSYFYEGHLKIPQGSAIKEGQELRVDWYQFADVETVIPETDYCLPEAWESLRENLKDVDSLMGHNNWLWMGMNEWRVAGWNEQCEMMKVSTTGEYMGKSLRMIQDLLWSKNGCRDIYTWSDMFDPYHNAWKPYAMTNGGCLESWKDLHDSTIIVNWSSCPPSTHWRPLSTSFYMGIDDSLNPQGKVIRQILKTADAGEASSWAILIDKLEKKGGKGVIGMAYVDWYCNYNQTAAVANAYRAYGRWGTGPLPKRNCASGISDKKAHPANRKALGNVLTSRAKGKLNVRFTAEKPTDVQLSVIDLQGRQIQTIRRKGVLAGNQQISLDTRSIPAGIYFLSLSLNEFGKHTLKQLIF